MERPQSSTNLQLGRGPDLVQHDSARDREDSWRGGGGSHGSAKYRSSNSRSGARGLTREDEARDGHEQPRAVAAVHLVRERDHEHGVERHDERGREHGRRQYVGVLQEHEVSPPSPTPYCGSRRPDKRTHQVRTVDHLAGRLAVEHARDGDLDAAEVLDDHEQARVAHDQALER
jgi:hypothetical protein